MKTKKTQNKKKRFISYIFKGLFKENDQEIELYSNFASEYFAHKPGNTAVNIILFLCTVIPIILQIIFNLGTAFEIVLLVFLFVLDLFFILNIFAGNKRIRNYSIWLKREKSHIDAILAEVDGNEKKRVIENLVEEAKTIELIKYDQDIFKKISPPHMWSSYRVTLWYVMFGYVGACVITSTIIYFLKDLLI